MAIAFAIFASFIWYSWYRRNAQIAKVAEAASARSGTLALDNDGIRTTLLSGASTFIPWSSYDKWKEGRTVFFLTGSDGAAVLPIDDGCRDSIRSFLVSKIS